MDRIGFNSLSPPVFYVAPASGAPPSRFGATPSPSISSGRGRRSVPFLPHAASAAGASTASSRRTTRRRDGPARAAGDGRVRSVRAPGGADAARVAALLVQPVVQPVAPAPSRVALGAPGVEKAAKRKAVVLPYSTYISDLYGTVLVTPKSIVERDPDLVRRFTGALLRGLAYAIDHPEEAGQILQRASPAQDPVLEMSPSGEAIAAWWRSTPGGYILQASVRPPGGSFGPAQDIDEKKQANA